MLEAEHSSSKGSSNHPRRGQCCSKTSMSDSFHILIIVHMACQKKGPKEDKDKRFPRLQIRTVVLQPSDKDGINYSGRS